MKYPNWMVRYILPLEMNEENQEIVRKKATFWKVDLSQPRYLPGGAEFAPWDRRLALWIALILFLVFVAPGLFMLVISTPPVLCVVSQALWPYSSSCEVEIAIIVIASAAICAITAYFKRRRVWLWAICGAILPFISLLVLLARPKVSEEKVENH